MKYDVDELTLAKMKSVVSQVELQLHFRNALRDMQIAS